MKILLCVAGLPYAESTVGFGQMLSKTIDSSFTILHVCRRPKERADAERIVQSAYEMLGVQDANRRVRQGDPAREILAEIKTQDYDLVVVGANQAPDLRQRLLGSVALSVARQAPASVLVVKSTTAVLESLLICTGGTDRALPVVEAGAQLAKQADAQATLLHIGTPAPSMYTGLDEIEESLSELLQTDTPFARHLRAGADLLARKRVNAKIKLRYGVVCNEVVRECQEGEHDLVVVGASGSRRGGIVRGWLMGWWLLGDITQQVLNEAPCSVLVVKENHPWSS